MAIFDSWGVRHPVTVLQLDECEVLQVRGALATHDMLNSQLSEGERNTHTRKERKGTRCSVFSSGEN